MTKQLVMCYLLVLALLVPAVNSAANENIESIELDIHWPYKIEEDVNSLNWYKKRFFVTYNVFSDEIDESIPRGLREYIYKGSELSGGYYRYYEGDTTVENGYKLRRKFDTYFFNFNVRDDQFEGGYRFEYGQSNSRYYNDDNIIYSDFHFYGIDLHCGTKLLKYRPIASNKIGSEFSNTDIKLSGSVGYWESEKGNLKLHEDYDMTVWVDIINIFSKPVDANNIQEKINKFKDNLEKSDKLVPEDLKESAIDLLNDKRITGINGTVTALHTCLFYQSHLHKSKTTGSESHPYYYGGNVTIYVYEKLKKLDIPLLSDMGILTALSGSELQYSYKTMKNGDLAVDLVSQYSYDSSSKVGWSKFLNTKIKVSIEEERYKIDNYSRSSVLSVKLKFII